MNCKALLVAGGGGGGGSFSNSYVGGGGGGAGEVLYNSSFTIPSFGIYNIVVGAGGTGGYQDGSISGGDSTFSTLTSVGGGRGGTGYFNNPGSSANGGNGASGGGGGGTTSGTTYPGTGITGKGYNGTGNQGWSGGGGGGAGATASGSNGGNGVQNDITGTNTYYAGGGAGSGGTGGGSGTEGLGVYGKGGNGTYDGGVSGNSGVVILSFATTDVTDNYYVRTSGATVTTSGSNTIYTYTSNGTISIYKKGTVSNPKITSIEAWGTGGVGTDASSSRGAGGSGGGAYVKSNNIYLDPSFTYTFPIVIASDTQTNFAGGIVIADNGRRGDGVFYSGGAGGQASNCVGDVAYSGGNGGLGTTVDDLSGGGGGSAGPDGAGLNGEDYGTGTGGVGDNGSGGIGGTRGTTNGADNALGGGGGAGGGNNGYGTSGGFPGGGGGGGEFGGGSPGGGQVIIKYVTSAFGNCTGGTKTTDGIYTVHTFTSSEDFVVLLSIPTVTTEAITNIDILSVTANGTLVTDGDFIVTEKGFVYSKTTNPTTADTKIIVAGSSEGTYTSPITSLTANTLYYIRAYAINTNGTSYGNEVSFTTLEPSAKTLYKDISGIEGQQYTVSLNVGGSAGSVSVKLGSLSTPHVINAGAGITVFSDIYSGLSGLSIEASDGFIGTIDDVFYVLTIGTPVIDWALSALTLTYPINSSVTFKRIEDKEITRFNLYRYLDAQFKDLDGYVTVTIVEEKNDLSYSKSKQFLVGNTGTTVSPFVKKRISMLSKNQAILITLSNNKLNETFTICQYSLTGFKESRKLYKLGKIISI